MADNKKNINMEYLVKTINNELDNFFNKKISELDEKDTFFIDITKNLKEYTLRGGKRIRPIFLIYGYRAIKGDVDKSIIKLSIFLELIQSSLLIHDDIMDQDKIRRGGLTIHEKYSDFFSHRDERFGDSMAIIMGDMAMNFAYEIISESDIEDNLKAKIISMVSRYVTQVDYGQSMDIQLARTDNFNEKDVKSVHFYKTMIYTTMMPLMVGAVLAGAKNNELKYIKKYAEDVGLAFQVQDDIMGLYGDQKTVGKPIGSDIKENKKTLLIFRAIEKASVSDKKYLLNCLGNSEISNKDIEKVREIVKNTGAYKYSLDLAKKLVGLAIESINEANLDRITKSELINISKYIITRNK